MSSTTPNLGFVKKDPIIDGNETFNIETMLNENWDKVDSHAGDTTRHLTAEERVAWNAKETTSGAQEKADDALAGAKEYTDEHAVDYVKHPADGGTTGGTATAYTCASTPDPTVLVDKSGVVITVHEDSGASPTLQWGTLAAAPMITAAGKAVKLKKDGIYTFRYSAGKAAFILQGEGGEYGTATAADVLAGKTVITENNGVVNGTMPNQVGKTVSVLSGSLSATGDINLQPISNGYMDSTTTISAHDDNLIPENYLQGKPVLGRDGAIKTIENNRQPLDVAYWPPNAYGNPNAKVHFKAPKGYCDGNVYLSADFPWLIPDNVLAGIVTPWFTGTGGTLFKGGFTNSPWGETINVGFAPTLVIVVESGNARNYFAVIGFGTSFVCENGGSIKNYGGALTASGFTMPQLPSNSDVERRDWYAFRY